MGTDFRKAGTRSVFQTSMARLMSVPLKALALALALAGVARADRVHLKNGEVLEGMVEKDTAESVTLNVGIGSVTLSRSRIARIERGGEAETARLQADWRQHYFSHTRFVPPGLEDLAQAFHDTESRRKDAVEAQQALRGAQQRRVAQLMELQRMEQQAVAVSRELKEASPERDLTRYNELVQLSNQLNAQSVLIRDSLQKDIESAEKRRALIPEYLSALHAFSLELDTRRARYAEGDPALVFFDEVDKRLQGYEREFEELDIPFENQGGHVVVTARLNDQVNGRFLLDTGASLLTLSDDLARRLDLHMPASAKLKMTVADGRKVEARPTILSSVRVGDAVVSNVAAAVVEARPSDGLDGLLGMSFLREFLIRLDPAREKLILERFTPP